MFILFLILFVIYGLNLFNGKMVFCNDGEDIINFSDCVGEYFVILFNNEWLMFVFRVVDNFFFNFDDFGLFFFILF